MMMMMATGSAMIGMIVLLVKLAGLRHKIQISTLTDAETHQRILMMMKME